jgi:hypothetical protein
VDFDITGGGGSLGRGGAKIAPPLFFYRGIDLKKIAKTTLFLEVIERMSLQEGIEDLFDLDGSVKGPALLLFR